MEVRQARRLLELYVTSNDEAIATVGNKVLRAECRESNVTTQGFGLITTYMCEIKARRRTILQQSEKCMLG